MAPTSAVAAVRASGAVAENADQFPVAARGREHELDALDPSRTPRFLRAAVSTWSKPALMVETTLSEGPAARRERNNGSA